MKIRPDEITQLKQTPLQLFYQGIKSEATKLDYENKLKKVVCEFLGSVLKGDPELAKKSKVVKFNPRSFQDGDFEPRVNEFVRKSKQNPEWVEIVILTMVKKLRERTELPKEDPEFLKVPSINNYVRPIQKLFDMNGILVSWKKIKSTFPTNEDKDDSREYTYKEIQEILSHCREMDKVLVLLACSSGIRAGAFTLQWKHIIPVYLYNEKYCFEEQDVTESVTRDGKVICVLIRTYAKSGSEYFAFGTPELWNAIEAYNQIWIQEIGLDPKPDDMFFKRNGCFARGLDQEGIRRRMNRIVTNAGLRPPLPKGRRRHNVPLFNGFRRFFNKANKKSLSKNSVLASLILKENMMGHTGLIPLDENYFKENIDELIEEYILSIPTLTMSDEGRLRFENELKQNKISELEKKTAKIDELELIQKKMMFAFDLATSKQGKKWKKVVNGKEVDMIKDWTNDDWFKDYWSKGWKKVKDKDHSFL